MRSAARQGRFMEEEFPLDSDLEWIPFHLVNWRVVMRSAIYTLSVVLLVAAVVTASGPTRPAEPVRTGKAPFADVPFKGRVKFDQKFERVMKINVDPEAMPFDSATLTTVINSPAVAGAAARDTFGLTADEYATYIKVTATTSVKVGAVIAKLDLACRADGRIPTPALNAFVENLRKHLQLTLESSINVDRKSIEKRQDSLIERKNYLEKKYVEIWTNRVRVAEDAGLAEHSVDGKRSIVGQMEENLRETELDILLRESRIDATKKEMDTSAADARTPAPDPLADELEKLVRIRTKQLDAAGADSEEQDAAEARMLEAKLRWIERVEELEKLKPEARLKVLQTELAELQIKKDFYNKTLTTSIDEARSLFRYNEHVLLLTKKEVALDKAIDRIDEQFDELANYSDKLGSITVTIIGQE